MKKWIVYNPNETFDSELGAKCYLSYMENIYGDSSELVVLEVDTTGEVKLIWGYEILTTETRDKL